MEQGRRVNGYLQPLPLGSRLRAADYHGPPLPPRQCPRCQSNETKFCYFNNYNVSQPRYYCRACKRHWTHGGIQRDIPSGGKSHKGKRTTNRRPRRENQTVQPLRPQLQPFCPPTNVAPLAFIPPMVPPMMTPYAASVGFLPPTVAEATYQPQYFQPTAMHYGPRAQNFLFNNTDGAGSSNTIPLSTTIDRGTTSGGTNVGSGSLIANPNEWLDFSPQL